MNTLINTNDDIIRFQLRKVTHYWGYAEGSFIYYMLGTPWVRTYVVSYSLYSNMQNDQSNLELIKGKTPYRVQPEFPNAPPGFVPQTKKPILFSKDITID